MALCRCELHPTVPNYTHYVEPVGYPETSSICGIPNCNEPGLIWLKADEVLRFNNNPGNRIFTFDYNVTKVKVNNNINLR